MSYSVFVFEPDRDIRKVMVLSFLSTGYVVYSVLNQANVIAQALETRPHVFVADLPRPVLAGLEFIAYLCRTFPRIPVIVLSTDATEATEAAAKAAGAADFLGKPFSPRVLLAKVTDQLNQNVPRP